MTGHVRHLPQALGCLGVPLALDRDRDAHELTHVAAVLACFLRFDALPRERLAGSLDGAEHAVRVTIGLALPPDRSLPDTWTALGGELKPSLDLIVTTPVVTGRSTFLGPLVREEPRMGIFGPAVPREETGPVEGTTAPGPSA